MADADEDDASFHRQRRNLFAVSGAIWLWVRAGAIAEPSFTLLGGSVHLARPSVLFNALMMLWGYWFIRYCQAFFDFKLSAARTDVVNAFNTKMGRIGKRKGKRRISSDGKTIKDGEFKGRRLLDIEATRLPRTWERPQCVRVHPVILENDGSRVRSAWHIDVVVGVVDRLEAWIRASVLLIFAKTTFSEYALPFLVGVSVLCPAYEHWTETAPTIQSAYHEQWPITNSGPAVRG